MSQEEFREIAHSGGQVVIRIGPDAQGRRSYQQTWRQQRPVASAIFAIYALAQGVPVCGLPLGGMGSPMPPPPFPGCYMVFIGSDSEGKFGHECPACRGYWRDQAGTNCCPYCGAGEDIHAFLTAAQQSYVRQYCSKMREVVQADVDGEYIIDMDAVADASGNDVETAVLVCGRKPAEQVQMQRMRELQRRLGDLRLLLTVRNTQRPTGTVGKDNSCDS
jgi:hypothetical protein